MTRFDWLFGLRTFADCTCSHPGTARRAPLRRQLPVASSDAAGERPGGCRAWASDLGPGVVSRAADEALERARPLIAIDARCLQRRGIGVSVVLGAVLDDLCADGWAMVLVTDRAEHAEQLRAGPWPSEVVLLPAASWLWWDQVSVARWLWRQQPDVWLSPRNYGIPLAHPRRTEMAVVVHDLIPLVLPGLYLRPRLMWAAMYLVSTYISLFNADLVLAVSERTAADVRRYSRRKSEVRYPPVPERLAGPPPERPPGAPPGPFVVYHGGFDARKNIGPMLDGFAQFRASPAGAGSSLVVIGDRPELAASHLAERGLSGAAVVTGFVEENEKWAYLAHALAVLYPSTYEGFGLVLAEAFAAGVPVVSGPGGSLREVGGDGAIFVDPTSAPSIAQGLCSACDGGTRRRSIEAGYRQLEVLRARSGGYARSLRGLLG